jgi:hypothetical protein
MTPVSNTDVLQSFGPVTSNGIYSNELASMEVLCVKQTIPSTPPNC